MNEKDIGVLAALAIVGIGFVWFVNAMGDLVATHPERVWSYTSKETNPFDRKTTNYVIEARRDGWVVYFNQTNTTEKYTNSIEEFKTDKEYVGFNKTR